MKLVGEKVILRYPKIEDAEEFVKQITHPDVKKTLSNPMLNDLNIKKEKDWIKKIEKRRNKKEEINFAILEKNTNKLIGCCGFNKIDKYINWAELGYWIAKPYWGKGYASDAVSLLLKYGFIDLRLNRIEALCLTNNKGSIRVQEKCGFKKEGTLKQRGIYLGKPHDAYINALLKSEWENADNRN